MLTLSHLRLEEGDTTFKERYKQGFKSSSIAVGLRDTNGVGLWANKIAEKLHGNTSFDKGPVDLLESYSSEVRGLLKNQMTAERSGIAFPYTIAYLNPKTEELLFLRSYPTLILPHKGKTPVYTSVYIAEISNDCERNYYDYCRTLLNVIHPA